MLARDGTIHVHELASGKEVWSLPLKTPWGSVVVVAGHALVTGLREVHLLDLRQRSARVLAVPGGVGHPAARPTDFVLVEGGKPCEGRRSDRWDDHRRSRRCPSI
ncbi:MAG: hypothetical protein IPJ34_42370 [Myxococcales bacterium]|nr:hypothetical protein [Myxococcales bacterium]